MKNYETTINGVSHTFQLSDEDAVKRGLDPAKDAKGDTPLETSPLEFGTPSTDGEQVEANVAADQAAAKVREEAAREAEAKATAAATKARTAANKAAAPAEK